MFFSPILTLVLHRVIPFERTWLFLIFPSAICFGFALQNLAYLLKSKLLIEYFNKYKLFVYFLILSTAIFALSRFPSKHEHFCETDFVLKELRERYFDDLQPEIKTISATNKGSEFYSAQVIWHFCLKDNPKRVIKLQDLVSIANQEILIIHLTELPRFESQLKNYKIIKVLKNEIYIYLRSDLC
jgi:hypothetical protein